ncbi:MAG: DUF3791 domain-containing protein [Spirochaetaceae bacterium]|jgi:hypothetical protein|nr:DUF3791 domain-containing protein [Spirochaetaceae bacterium]
MCEEPVNFLLFCIEFYKNIHNMEGARVYALFDLYKVTDFILKHHETLHIEGPHAIIKQLDEFIANSQKN